VYIGRVLKTHVFNVEGWILQVQDVNACIFPSPQGKREIHFSQKIIFKKALCFCPGPNTLTTKVAFRNTITPMFVTITVNMSELQ
jgi:hypothetical protein